jgi:hypothetical protein
MMGSQISPTFIFCYNFIKRTQGMRSKAMRDPDIDRLIEQSEQLIGETKELIETFKASQARVALLLEENRRRLNELEHFDDLSHSRQTSDETPV